MIRKPNGSDAKRLGTGVLVVGMAAAGAVALASPASAAAGTITASPAQSNYQAGATATINVTTTGAPTSLRFDITAGPDSTTTSRACTAVGQSTTSYTCQFANSPSAAGTDTVRVFDDVNGSGVYASNDPSTTTQVTFTGAPTTVTLSPTNGGSANVGSPVTFTATATDSSGNPAVGRTLTITSTEQVTGTGGTTPTSPLSYADAGTTGTTAGTNSCTAIASGATTSTCTATETVTTDSTGKATTKPESSQAGTVSVQASYSNTVTSGTSTFTVTGGLSGNNNVATITAAPTSQNAAAGGHGSVTVTATDSSGNPVGGATISYAITSGPDATGTGVYRTCPNNTSQSNGQTTCYVPGSAATVANAGAGTDNVQFFVNQTISGNQQSNGPDPSEPKATASVTFAAQPAYDSITLTTTDPSNNGASDSNAQVPPGTASSTFTATVKEKDANGVEQPVSGAVVTFTVTQGNATASPTSATTNANGQATTTVTPAATTANTTYTVSATIGSGSSYNGTGSNAATATVTYTASAAQAPTISPTTQNRQSGGSATVTATVTDQYGTAQQGVSVTFAVTGRNSVTATQTTNASGQATFTYNDTGSATTSGTDNVRASDSAGNSNATVNWVSGGATVTKVAVSTGTAAQMVGTTANRAVTATVTNSSNQPLSGESVVFTVDKGYVGTSGSTSTTDTKTYTATTNTNGVATAYVGSTTTGTQTVTATDGSVSGSGTVTYTAGSAATVTISPATTTIAAGGTQKFTATVVDAQGNGVGGESVVFTVSGQTGNINGTSSATVTTASDGTASAILSVPSSATNGQTGTITATDSAATTTKSASATYTVGKSTNVAAVSAYLAKGAAVGSTTDFASSEATDAAGNPVSGAVLQFVITGSTSTMGTATTGTNGIAKFSFVPENAGALSVKVTSVDNSDATATASGSTARGYATTQLTQVSPQKYRIRDTANVSVHRAGIQVDFYQTLASGRNKYVGSDDTDANGQATFTIYSLRSGYVYKGIAKVSGGDPNFDGPNSATRSTTVK